MRCAPRLLLLLLCFAACASNEKKANRTRADEKKYAAAVKQGTVLYGMTESEVSDAVGKPIRKRSDTLYRRPMKRWDYHGFSLYFDEEGYVTKIERAGY